MEELRRELKECKEQLNTTRMQIDNALQTCERMLQHPERKMHASKIECAEICGDLLFWGTADGKCYCRPIDEPDKEPLLILDGKRSPDHGYAHIFIKALENGGIAIASLPFGIPVLFIVNRMTPPPIHAVMTHFNASMHQRNMGLWNGHLLVAGNTQDSLETIHIHSGESMTILQFERRFITYATYEDMIFVSFPDELRIFQNLEIVESIALPPTGRYSESYCIQLVTDHYLFFQEHVLDRMTNRLTLFEGYVLNTVQLANGDIYGISPLHELMQWQKEKWIKCKSEKSYHHLLVQGNDLYGVTHSDIHPIDIHPIDIHPISLH